MSKLSTRPPFVGTEIQDTDLIMIAIDNGDTTFTSQKIDGADLKALVVPSTPSSEVAFDKLTPTTAGVVFDPNTPATTDILYYSTVDGSTWIYNGTVYVSKIIPDSTEFVLDSSFNDAGSNKTAGISRNGYVKVRENNTLLSRFTQLFSYGINIVSDTYAQLFQTAVSTTVHPLTRMTRKRGTITSQTVALNNDFLGQYTFNGGNGDCASITAIASQDHTTFAGTKIIISNVPNGSNSPVNSIIINEANGVDFIGTITAPNIIGQIDARVQSITSSATVTPTSTNDLVKITAQATGLTLANPTGTFTEGQALMIRIKDNGTARGITFDTNYRAIGITLPTTTVISKTMYLGIIYNSTDAKWDIVGLNQQA